VYRERYPLWLRGSRVPTWEQDGAPLAAEPEAGASARDRAESGSDKSARQSPPAAAALPLPSSPPRSYPGTGWGPRTDDQAELVAFDPHPHPVEQVTLRYEYREALIALGIDPRSWPSRDRLLERELGREGFARPPVR
jgi:hypothetical protein